MKKSVLFFCLLLSFSLFVKAQNNSCAGTADNPFPYQPDFGVVGDTAEEVKFWLFGPYISDLYWSFRNYSSNKLVLYYESEEFMPADESIVSRCIALDENEKYRLSFTYTGVTPGMTNQLQIFFVRTGADIKDSIAKGKYTLIEVYDDLEPGARNIELLIDGDIVSSGDYHLGFFSNNPNQNGEFFIDQIKFEMLNSSDLYLHSFNSPISKCDLDNQKVSLRIENIGLKVQESYRLCYTVNGSAARCQNFLEPIAVNETKVVEFTTAENFPDEALLSAWIVDSYGDGNKANDTIKRHVIKKTSSQTIPYVCNFDSYESYEDWQVISKDPDGHAYTWELSQDISGGPATINTSGIKSDDWLTTGCIELKKDTVYKISFSYHASSSTFFEKMSFYVGTNNAISDLTTPLIALDSFNNEDTRLVSAYYKAEQDAVHFFGFHAYSRELSGGISIESFSVETYTPLQLPVLMGFESMEKTEDWIIFDYNNSRKGWTLNNQAGSAAFGSAIGLYTQSLETQTKGTNTSWLVSPPIYLDADITYELVYARKSENVSYTEYLNVYLLDEFSVETASLENMICRDTIKTITYTPKVKHLKADQSGLYYLAFKYNSPKGTKSLYLDEIMLRDSAVGADTNLAVINIEIPDISCSSLANSQIYLTVKNLSGYTIPTQSVSVFYELNGVTTMAAAKINSAIAPYTNCRHAISGVNMSGADEYYVRAGISYSADKKHENDTSAYAYTKEYDPFEFLRFGFEATDDLLIWKRPDRNDNNKSWQFVVDAGQAYMGTGIAYLENPNSTSEIKDLLVSPCLNTRRDKTYMISFAYKMASDHTASTLNVRFGEGGSSMDPIVHTVNVNNEDYQNVVFYVKTSNARTRYVSLEAVSAARLGGLYIDDFLFVDSIEAQIPELELVSLNLISGTNCDLNAFDSLEISVKNNAYVDYQNPLVRIRKSDGSVLSETLNGLAMVGQTSKFKLHTAWIHSNWGKDSLQIYLDLDADSDRSNDTSRFIYSERYLPVSTPYATNLDAGNRNGWNNLSQKNLNTYATSGNNPAYFTFETSLDNPANTYAQYVKGQAGRSILASHCIDLLDNEYYKIDYKYKAYNAIGEENLRVVLLRPDGRLDTIYTHPAFSNASFTDQTVRFKAQMPGNYKVIFLTNFTPESRGLMIDNFGIMVDTASWPADVQLLSLLSPNSSENLTSQETVSVSVKNGGRRPLRNVPVVMEIDDVPVVDYIPALDSGQQVVFTFNQKADMSEEKSYNLQIYSQLSDDTDRSNDTLKAVVEHSEAPADIQLLALLQPQSSEELTAQETFILSVRNAGRRDLVKIPLVLEVDGNVYHDTIPKLDSAKQEQFTFTRKIDMSQEKVYNIRIYANLENDVNRLNDTLSLNVEHQTDGSSIVKTESDQLHIYPNPAKDIVYIQSEFPIKTLRVFNISGQILMQVNLNSSQFELNVSTLPEGLYILYFETENGNYQHRQLIRR